MPDFEREAVRLGNYKGVRLNFGRLELYDLGSDSYETVDIAAAHPDIVLQIEGLMGGYCVCPKRCNWLPVVVN